MIEIWRGDRIVRGLVAAIVVLAGAAAWDLATVIRIERWNTAIAAGRDVIGAPAAVHFAAAYALAERGQAEAALDLYRALAADDSSATPAAIRVRRDAAFNGATLYLARAMQERSGVDPNAALALIELAKQTYRELLREDGADWDARYNLERALRLAPDANADAPDLPPPPDTRRMPSSERGAALGLP